MTMKSMVREKVSLTHSRLSSRQRIRNREVQSEDEKKTNEKIEQNPMSCAGLVSVFVFLCGHNFFQIVIVRTE